MRAQIEVASDSDWQPLIDKKGKAISGQETYRTSFCIGDYGKAFTLIIQGKALKGQTSLDLESQDSSEGLSLGGYIYRAIATNQWYAAIGDNTLADAILDRLMHNSHRLIL